MIHLLPDNLVKQMMAIDSELADLERRIDDDDPQLLNDFYAVKFDLEAIAMVALQKRIPDQLMEQLNLASQELSRAVRFGKFTEVAAKSIGEARKKIGKLIKK